MSSATRRLVELGDVDELVRHVDRLCEAADWDGLVEARDLSRAALERGRQLWPVACRAEYRLALDAPGRWAARVLVPGAGRFALGPLHEVAASTHSWDELAPHVDQEATEATLTAHERVVRGERLTGDRRVDPRVLEVPLEVQPWEPEYPVAVYSADEAHFPVDPVTGFGPAEVVEAGAGAEDPETLRALAELAGAWTSGSEGRVSVAAVHGSARAAVAALEAGPVRMAPLVPARAMALMAWTAASGGAFARRRGMAAGRFSAWWAASALAGLAGDYPPDAAELGEAVAELGWWAWDGGGPEVGWSCRLAVEDRADGLAWALAAVDRGRPAPEPVSPGS